MKNVTVMMRQSARTPEEIVTVALEAGTMKSQVIVSRGLEMMTEDKSKGVLSGLPLHEPSSKEASPRKCPLCKTIYGMDIDLQELWMDERKIYQCKNRNATHDFCEHVLVATRKDIGRFSCQNCSSSIDECDCFDCMMIFCEQCNSFINLTCSDVVQMMDINEETTLLLSSNRINLIILSKLLYVNGNIIYQVLELFS